MKYVKTNHVNICPHSEDCLLPARTVSDILQILDVRNYSFCWRARFILKEEQKKTKNYEKLKKKSIWPFPTVSVCSCSGSLFAVSEISWLPCSLLHLSRQLPSFISGIYHEMMFKNKLDDISVNCRKRFTEPRSLPFWFLFAEINIFFFARTRWRGDCGVQQVREF